MQPPKCAKIVSKIEKIRVFNRLDFQNQGSRAGGVGKNLWQLLRFRQVKKISQV